MILLELLNNTFDKSTKENIQENYLKDLKDIKKWKCFSDYCLDDKNKPNDVITFSIFPYISDYFVIENHIKKIAKVDIKKTKFVQNQFIKFLKEYPLINFSFILDDRKLLFGETSDKRKDCVLDHLNWVKELYAKWIKNEPEKESYYNKTVKIIDSCILEVKHGKKINIYIDVFLISFLGAYVTYIILNEVKKIDVIGWFSDRDKIFEVGNGIVINLFQNNLHGLLTEEKREFQFASSMSDSNFDTFYDQFIKVPDYIAGTLADYNMDENLISKDKFNTVLTDYMGDNTQNNFVFRIFKDDNHYKCGKIHIIKK